MSRYDAVISVRGEDVRRREFLSALGGAAAWPLAARAQQAKVPKIGILVPAEREPFFSGFHEGLRRHGYFPGQNIQIEFRSAEGQPSRLPELAEELVKLNVDVLVANQTPAVHAAKAATRTIPIAMSAGDPVGTGLVESLARPGGNITGMSATTGELSGKMLELIREVQPSARRIAVLANPTDPFTKPFLAQIQRGATALGLGLKPIMVPAIDKADGAIAEAVQWKADAVIVQPTLPRRRIIGLLLQNRLMSVSPTRVFVADGGLISYASNVADNYREVAAYVDKILKGARPADLPVQQPTKFELAVNLKTAKAIGVTIPPTIMARADEVIE